QDYKKAEVAFQENGALRYVANPAFIFGDWGRLGPVGAMPLDKDMLRQKIEMHEYAIALIASPNYVRRYTVLLVLDGRPDEALLQVRRLQRLSANNFELQLKWLVAMCDDQFEELTAFREQLFRIYGPPERDSAAS
ncbi:MAG: hypothetical protein HOQ37_14310, partial [Cupriavidus sp.]|nr:hypothetical protein [Cupriavidus sp.]